MTSLPSNFPRRVRIRGGEFGASARAMHRKAAFENVSSATIERKTMSTKTKFKRIALVAVAALGIGMVSALPSHAAPAFGDVGVYSAGTQIIGGQATVYLDVDTAIVTNVVTTGVGSIVSAANAASQPAGYANAASIGTASSSFTVTGAAGNRSRVNLVYTSNVVGTTTITATPLDSNGIPGTAVTKTITWIAGATNAVVNHSTAFIGANTSGVTEVVADATLTPLAPASATAIGQIDVRQYADSGTTATATASTSAVTVTIAGAGSVSSTATGGATGPSVTIAAGGGAANRFTLYVYANGVAGTGTITVSVGGVTVATKTVTFVGTLASFKTTPTKTVIGVGSTDPVAVAGLDTNANAAALGTYYIASSNTAVATVPASVTAAGSTGLATVTGVAVGTATITITNAATAPTITKTFTVTVGKATIKTLTMKTDKTSYSAGEKVVLTVTGLGSDGLAVGDAALSAFSSVGVTSNVGLQGTLPVTSVTFVGGVATYTLYAPLQDGTVTLTGLEGASTDNVIANTTTAAATISTSFDVANPASGAAVDAANAATDAANYAADAADAATTAAQEATAAAQAAQDSADAATAAVVALGLRVDTLMASVRAQLTSLSNLLVRIIKKTHA